MAAMASIIPCCCGITCAQALAQWNSLEEISMSGVLCATETGTSCPLDGYQIHMGEARGPYTAVPDGVDANGNRKFRFDINLGGHTTGESHTVRADLIYSGGGAVLTHVRLSVSSGWGDFPAVNCSRIDHGGVVTVNIPWECKAMTDLLVGVHLGPISAACVGLQTSVTVHSIA